MSLLLRGYKTHESMGKEVHFTPKSKLPNYTLISLVNRNTGKAKK
jgi:hypothetical protein